MSVHTILLELLCPGSFMKTSSFRIRRIECEIIKMEHDMQEGFVDLYNHSSSTTFISNHVIYTSMNETNAPILFTGGNVQLKETMKTVSNRLLIAIVCVVMTSLGCTIKLGVLKSHFRRPVGLVIGLVCQFIIFPAVTFGLAHVLRLEKWLAIGMILLGTAPGGHVSNILTYYCDGDVTLR